MGTKVSDEYPGLVNKKYCGDCIYLGLERKDGVVTGLCRCDIWGYRSAFQDLPASCSNFKDKTEYLSQSQ